MSKQSFAYVIEFRRYLLIKHFSFLTCCYCILGKSRYIQVYIFLIYQILCIQIFNAVKSNIMDIEQSRGNLSCYTILACFSLTYMLYLLQMYSFPVLKKGYCERKQEVNIENQVRKDIMILVLKQNEKYSIQCL